MWKGEDMRQLTIFYMAIILPALASGQLIVSSGYVIDSPPGVYAQPFVPRLSTPSMSFENVSPSPVGASNATAGNLAGATNATLSVFPAGPVVQYPPSLALGLENSPIESGAEAEARAEAESRGEATAAETRPLELGVASFQDSYGVAQLAASSRARQQAKKLYTNLDVERMNQMTGMVKYEGKTERLE
jgi:hypothetical protein